MEAAFAELGIEIRWEGSGVNEKGYDAVSVAGIHIVRLPVIHRDPVRVQLRRSVRTFRTGL